MFEGALESSSFVELQISLTSASATGSSTCMYSLIHLHNIIACYIFYTDADYSVLPIPSTLSLNITNAQGCVSIGITNDNIVEGTEMFLVNFIETDDNQIAIAGSSTAPVFIQDDESRFFKMCFP